MSSYPKVGTAHRMFLDPLGLEFLREEGYVHHEDLHIHINDKAPKSGELFATRLDYEMGDEPDSRLAPLLSITIPRPKDLSVPPVGEEREIARLSPGYLSIMTIGEDTIEDVEQIVRDWMDPTGDIVLIAYNDPSDN